MVEKPVFIQGLFSYVGSGLANPTPFATPATYLVPPDRRAQTIYFRAGNPSSELIYVVLTRQAVPMRYFPVGAKNAIHVPLAVVEDLPNGSSIELLVAAPRGAESTVLLDVGFMEIV